MIEIAKGLIDMIVLVINSMFNVPIQLSKTLTVKLGFIVIGFVLFAILLGFLFSLINIGGNNGGDD